MNWSIFLQKYVLFEIAINGFKFPSLSFGLIINFTSYRPQNVSMHFMNFLNRAIKSQVTVMASRASILLNIQLKRGFPNRKFEKFRFFSVIRHTMAKPEDVNYTF